MIECLKHDCTVTKGCSTDVLLAEHLSRDDFFPQQEILPSY